VEIYANWRARQRFNAQKRHLLWNEPDSVLKDLGIGRTELENLRYKANTAEPAAPRPGRTAVIVSFRLPDRRARSCDRTGQTEPHPADRFAG